MPRAYTRLSARGPKVAPRTASDRGVPQRLVDVILDVLAVNDADLTLDSVLTSDLGADDLDLMELGMACEDAFKIEISDAVLERWEQGRSLSGMISDLQRAGARL